MRGVVALKLGRKKAVSGRETYLFTNQQKPPYSPSSLLPFCFGCFTNCLFSSSLYRSRVGTPFPILTRLSFFCSRYCSTRSPCCCVSCSQRKAPWVGLQAAATGRNGRGERARVEDNARQPAASDVSTSAASPHCRAGTRAGVTAAAPSEIGAAQARAGFRSVRLAGPAVKWTAPVGSQTHQTIASGVAGAAGVAVRASFHVSAAISVVTGGVLSSHTSLDSTCGTAGLASNTATARFAAAAATPEAALGRAAPAAATTKVCAREQAAVGTDPTVPPPHAQVASYPPGAATAVTGAEQNVAVAAATAKRAAAATAAGTGERVARLAAGQRPEALVAERAEEEEEEEVPRPVAPQQATAERVVAQPPAAAAGIHCRGAAHLSAVTPAAAAAKEAAGTKAELTAVGECTLAAAKCVTSPSLTLAATDLAHPSAAAGAAAAAAVPGKPAAAAAAARQASPLRSRDTAVARGAAKGEAAPCLASECACVTPGGGEQAEAAFLRHSRGEVHAPAAPAEPHGRGTRSSDWLAYRDPFPSLCTPHLGPPCGRVDASPHNGSRFRSQQDRRTCSSPASGSGSGSGSRCFCSSESLGSCDSSRSDRSGVCHSRGRCHTSRSSVKRRRLINNRSGSDSPTCSCSRSILTVCVSRKSDSRPGLPTYATTASISSSSCSISSVWASALSPTSSSGRFPSESFSSGSCGALWPSPGLSFCSSSASRRGASRGSFVREQQLLLHAALARSRSVEELLRVSSSYIIATQQRLRTEAAPRGNPSAAGVHLQENLKFDADAPQAILAAAVSVTPASGATTHGAAAPTASSTGAAAATAHASIAAAAADARRAPAVAVGGRVDATADAAASGEEHRLCIRLSARVAADFGLVNAAHALQRLAVLHLTERSASEKVFTKGNSGSSQKAGGQGREARRVKEEAGSAETRQGNEEAASTPEDKTQRDVKSMTGVHAQGETTQQLRVRAHQTQTWPKTQLQHEKPLHEVRQGEEHVCRQEFQQGRVEKRRAWQRLHKMTEKHERQQERQQGPQQEQLLRWNQRRQVGEGWKDGTTSLIEDRRFLALLYCVLHHLKAVHRAAAAATAESFHISGAARVNGSIGSCKATARGGDGRTSNTGSVGSECSCSFGTEVHSSWCKNWSDSRVARPPSIDSGCSSNGRRSNTCSKSLRKSDGDRKSSSTTSSGHRSTSDNSCWSGERSNRRSSVDSRSSIESSSEALGAALTPTSSPIATSTAGQMSPAGEGEVLRSAPESPREPSQAILPSLNECVHTAKQQQKLLSRAVSSAPTKKTSVLEELKQDEEQRGKVDAPQQKDRLQEVQRQLELQHQDQLQQRHVDGQCLQGGQRQTASKRKQELLPLHEEMCHEEQQRQREQPPQQEEKTGRLRIHHGQHQQELFHQQAPLEREETAAGPQSMRKVRCSDSNCLDLEEVAAAAELSRADSGEAPPAAALQSQLRFLAAVSWACAKLQLNRLQQQLPDSSETGARARNEYEHQREAPVNHGSRGEKQQVCKNQHLVEQDVSSGRQETAATATAFRDLGFASESLFLHWPNGQRDSEKRKGNEVEQEDRKLEQLQKKEERKKQLGEEARQQKTEETEEQDREDHLGQQERTDAVRQERGERVSCGPDRDPALQRQASEDFQPLLLSAKDTSGGSSFSAVSAAVSSLLMKTVSLCLPLFNPCSLSVALWSVAQLHPNVRLQQQQQECSKGRAIRFRSTRNSGQHLEKCGILSAHDASHPCGGRERVALSSSRATALRVSSGKAQTRLSFTPSVHPCSEDETALGKSSRRVNGTATRRRLSSRDARAALPGADQEEQTELLLFWKAAAKAVLLSIHRMTLREIATVVHAFAAVDFRHGYLLAVAARQAAHLLSLAWDSPQQTLLEQQQEQQQQEQHSPQQHHRLHSPQQHREHPSRLQQQQQQIPQCYLQQQQRHHPQHPLQQQPHDRPEHLQQQQQHPEQEDLCRWQPPQLRPAPEQQPPQHPFLLQQPLPQDASRPEEQPVTHQPQLQQQVLQARHCTERQCLPQQQCLVSQQQQQQYVPKPECRSQQRVFSQRQHQKQQPHPLRQQFPSQKQRLVLRQHYITEHFTGEQQSAEHSHQQRRRERYVPSEEKQQHAQHCGQNWQQQWQGRPHVRSESCVQDGPQPLQQDQKQHTKKQRERDVALDHGDDVGPDHGEDVALDHGERVAGCHSQNNVPLYKKEENKKKRPPKVTHSTAVSTLEGKRTREARRAGCPSYSLPCNSSNLHAAVPAGLPAVPINGRFVYSQGHEKEDASATGGSVSIIMTSLVKLRSFSPVLFSTSASLLLQGEQQLLPSTAGVRGAAADSSKGVSASHSSCCALANASCSRNSAALSATMKAGTGMDDSLTKEQQAPSSSSFSSPLLQQSFSLPCPPYTASVAFCSPLVCPGSSSPASFASSPCGSTCSSFASSALLEPHSFSALCAPSSAWGDPPPSAVFPVRGVKHSTSNEASLSTGVPAAYHVFCGKAIVTPGWTHLLPSCLFLHPFADRSRNSSTEGYSSSEVQPLLQNHCRKNFLLSLRPVEATAMAWAFAHCCCPPDGIPVPTAVTTTTTAINTPPRFPHREQQQRTGRMQQQHAAASRRALQSQGSWVSRAVQSSRETPPSADLPPAFSKTSPIKRDKNVTAVGVSFVRKLVPHEEVSLRERSLSSSPESLGQGVFPSEASVPQKKKKSHKRQQAQHHEQRMQQEQRSQVQGKRQQKELVQEQHLQLQHGQHPRVQQRQKQEVQQEQQLQEERLQQWQYMQHEQQVAHPQQQHHTGKKHCPKENLLKGSHQQQQEEQGRKRLLPWGRWTAFFALKAISVHAVIFVETYSIVEKVRLCWALALQDIYLPMLFTSIIRTLEQQAQEHEQQQLKQIHKERPHSVCAHTAQTAATETREISGKHLFEGTAEPSSAKEEDEAAAATAAETRSALGQQRRNTAVGKGGRDRQQHTSAANAFGFGGGMQRMQQNEKKRAVAPYRLVAASGVVSLADGAACTRSVLEKQRRIKRFVDTWNATSTCSSRVSGGAGCGERGHGEGEPAGKRGKEKNDGKEEEEEVVGTHCRDKMGAASCSSSRGKYTEEQRQGKRLVFAERNGQGVFVVGVNADRKSGAGAVAEKEDGNEAETRAPAARTADSREVKNTLAAVAADNDAAEEPMCSSTSTAGDERDGWKTATSQSGFSTRVTHSSWTSSSSNNSRRSDRCASPCGSRRSRRRGRRSRSSRHFSERDSCSAGESCPGDETVDNRRRDSSNKSGRRCRSENVSATHTSWRRMSRTNSRGRCRWRSRLQRKENQVMDYSVTTLSAEQQQQLLASPPPDTEYSSARSSSTVEVSVFSKSKAAPATAYKEQRVSNTCRASQQQITETPCIARGTPETILHPVSRLWSNCNRMTSRGKRRPSSEACLQFSSDEQRNSESCSGKLNAHTPERAACSKTFAPRGNTCAEHSNAAVKCESIAGGGRSSDTLYAPAKHLSNATLEPYCSSVLPYELQTQFYLALLCYVTCETRTAGEVISSTEDPSSWSLHLLQSGSPAQSGGQHSLTQKTPAAVDLPKNDVHVDKPYKSATRESASGSATREVQLQCQTAADSTRMRPAAGSWKSRTPVGASRATEKNRRCSESKPNSRQNFLERIRQVKGDAGVDAGSRAPGAVVNQRSRAAVIGSTGIVGVGTLPGCRKAAQDTFEVQSKRTENDLEQCCNCSTSKDESMTLPHNILPFKGMPGGVDTNSAERGRNVWKRPRQIRLVRCRRQASKHVMPHEHTLSEVQKGLKPPQHRGVRSQGEDHARLDHGVNNSGQAQLLKEQMQVRHLCRQHEHFAGYKQMQEQAEQSLIQLSQHIQSSKSTQGNQHSQVEKQNQLHKHTHLDGSLEVSCCARLEDPRHFSTHGQLGERVDPKYYFALDKGKVQEQHLQPRQPMQPDGQVSLEPHLRVNQHLQFKDPRDIKQGLQLNHQTSSAKPQQGNEPKRAPPKLAVQQDVQLAGTSFFKVLLRCRASLDIHSSRVVACRTSQLHVQVLIVLRRLMQGTAVNTRSVCRQDDLSLGFPYPLLPESDKSPSVSSTPPTLLDASSVSRTPSAASESPLTSSVYRTASSNSMAPCSELFASCGSVSPASAVRENSAIFCDNVLGSFGCKRIRTGRMSEHVGPCEEKSSQREYFSRGVENGAENATEEPRGAKQRLPRRESMQNETSEDGDNPDRSAQNEARNKNAYSTGSMKHLTSCEGRERNATSRGDLRWLRGWRAQAEYKDPSGVRVDVVLAPS